MIKDIIIEVEGVSASDFDSNLNTPAYFEITDTGASLLFYDVEELKGYYNSLQAQAHDAQLKDAKAKVAAALKKVLRRNESVMDAIRSYAAYLFNFIFNADAHRKDRLMILDTVIADIQESAHSSELQKAVSDATFEIGDLSKNDHTKFYEYAHNQAQYDFQKIRASLIKELTDLRTGLLG